ncbi:hypothetical protein FMUND_15301 [Fusarium mundagurra]|uniref:Uncharacterized protein n=1 Tax=Fusarium mundagurra TaxID=1567541 RepID=A0A8H5XPR7_9HYPO|nr:hypothetical protein FMUND_15301 [Fusarium mundagurra]
MAEINPQISTGAVVGWLSRDTSKYLAEPDLKRRNLTFRTRFDKDSSFFEICIPIYLKHTGNKNTQPSTLILSIPFSTIETFSFQVLATVPQPVREKLSSQVLGLDFKLNENITILIPLDTKEQPMQGRTQSGVVLDNVREISRTNSISVYIDHTAVFEAQLNLIRTAINEGYYRSTRRSQLDLQSLYQGLGAQIARFPTQPEQVLGAQFEQLPAYDERPSSSLDTAAQKRKRPRSEPHGQETEADPSEAETLGKESQKRQELEERVATLEKERVRLEKALDDKEPGPGPGLRRAASEGQSRQTVKESIRTAKREIKALQKRIETAEKEIEALQKQNDKINFEGYDGRLWDVEQELNEVGEQYSDIKDNMVTEENLRDFGEDIKQDIAKRIMGDDH